MATGREGFEKVSGTTIVPPIPEFPKLPQCLKRNRSDSDLKEIEEYEKLVQKFFQELDQRRR